MYKRTKSIATFGAVIVAAICQLNTGKAFADTLLNSPTRLIVTMELESGTNAYCPWAFEREIEFAKDRGDPREENIVITVRFEEESECVYKNTDLDNTQLSKLQTLSVTGNRNHWDYMFLSNDRNRPHALHIENMSVTVEYYKVKNSAHRTRKVLDPTDHKEYWFGEMMIGGIYRPSVLGPDDNRIALSNWKIRAWEACRYLSQYDHFDSVFSHDYFNKDKLDFTNTQLRNDCIDDIENAFDPWVYEFMYDFGKSGTDIYDPDNRFSLPKYGWDEAMCSEGVTWYLAEYSSDENGFFSDPIHRNNYGDLYKAFIQQDTLYCFDDNQIPNDPQSGWRKCLQVVQDTNTQVAECANWGGRDETTIPRAGDVLIRAQVLSDHNIPPTWRKSGHSMMVVGWDATVDFNMHVLEGPGPVQFRRPVRIDSTNDQTVYCVGQIPENTGRLPIAWDEWTTVEGNAALDTTVEEGRDALEIQASSWNRIQSRDFDTSPLGRVTDTLAIAVKMPDPLPSPWWAGQLMASATCENAGLYNVPLGESDPTFLELTPGQFERVSFTLPSNVEAAFEQDGNTCFIDLQVNLPNLGGTYYFSDMKFID